ncbi:MAG: transporter [Silvibacterium sp.]
MKKRTLQLLLLSCISSMGAMGQIDCSTSTKLVCQIPFSTGVLNRAGSSVTGANSVAAGFNSAIATQVSQLPLASSSSGTVVLISNGVPQTYNNLGPILTDRASTVGKHHLFLSFTASQFVFTDIDGIPLGNVPFSYSAVGCPSSVPPSQCTVTTPGSSTVSIKEDLDIHFKINQYVAIATYGVMDKLDVSMVLPIERVSIGTSSFDTQEFIVDNTSNVGQGPFPGQPISSRGIASGIGDILFAAKYIVKSEERGTFSVGLNMRTPTGDARNYLGSGAWGTNPYAVFSYVSRVSPHVRLGYQWNSETELNPNLVRPGSNLALPGGLQYDVGADWAWTKKLTVAGDLMGNQYLNAPRLTPSSTTLTYENTLAAQPPPTTTVHLGTVTSISSSYWINDISTGVKWNPYRELILTGNVLFQLNNVGMRSRPTPLVGISYKF